MNDNTDPAPDPKGGFLTIAECAARLRVSPQTVARWVKDGRLKASRFGPRLLRVSLADLAEFQNGRSLE